MSTTIRATNASKNGIELRNYNELPNLVIVHARSGIVFNFILIESVIS